jgi:hypothetical protein
MNIGEVLSLHHRAEILTTTGRSRASAVVSGDWRSGACVIARDHAIVAEVVDHVSGTKVRSGSGGVRGRNSA